ncbi:hypothetical protein [Peptoniphilus hominis (ex Hitch et al. 2025)]|uniref:Cadherin-like beta sandwich domain n=1 Tax=Peptoniphilus hominis (ex Hitch et al. 2025) TaxID=3133174 RepID=A0ABV1CDZ9_9FIRM
MILHRWGKYTTISVPGGTTYYANPGAEVFLGTQNIGDRDPGDEWISGYDVYRLTRIESVPGGQWNDHRIWGVLVGTYSSSYRKKGSKIGKVTDENRRAYPDDGQKGDYWYIYEGVDNQAPTISGKDEDLGGFKAPFKKIFSVNDPDSNETLNVTVKLNAATIRTINNATKGESYEIDIDKEKFDGLELNKENTIEITVTDSKEASAIRRYTFKKINSNPVVTVTNSNLGEQNKPFSFSFKANDPDGDDITVKVYIDDVQVQDLGKVTPDQSKTVSIGKLDYAKLKNGNHKIKIEATDSFNAKGANYIEFSKNITYCWYRLTKEVDAQPSAIVTNVLAELAKGAKLTVKVSLNAKDANPTWEVVPEELIGQKYNFKTKTKTADKWCIGVEVRIDRDKTEEGFYSYFYGFVGAYM